MTHTFLKNNLFSTFKTTINFVLFCGFLSGAGVKQISSTFWAATHSPLLAEQATIPHMKEDSQSFHINPIA